MLSSFGSLPLFLFIIIPLAVDHSLTTAQLANEFIVEYFLRRAPATVVGFTCDQYENDARLVKKFSDQRLQSLVWKLGNPTDLSTLAKALHRRLGVFIDLRCQRADNVRTAFNEASAHKMFDELYYWLVLGADLRESLPLINDDSFGLSTDFVLAVPGEDRWLLHDIYNPGKIRGGELKIRRLGFWDGSAGLNIPLGFDKTRRWNLEGMRITISGLVETRPSDMPVAEYLQDLNYRQFDRQTRLGYAMWMHMADLFNFTLEFKESTVWNEGDDNGPVMTSLIKGEVDASGTADALTTERLDVVKAVYPALPFRTCFVFRSTSSDSISVRDIFLPLSSAVWYLTIAISVLSVNALAFLSILSKEDIYENYLRSIIINVGAFCQQGTEFSSDNLSGRIAILHILLFNLLLYNYYLASAVSNRISEPMVPINDSLHALGKKDFQYASEPMIDFDRHIKNNDWETRSFYINRWLKIPKSQRFMSPEMGMSLVLKGGFAYHTQPEISYPYVERYFDLRKICELQEVHLIKPLQLSLFVHVNSSFTEMFRAGFIKLSEVGIRFRQIRLWTASKPICRTDVLTADSITIKEIAPAIIFLIISILVSGTLLSLEFFYSTYHKGLFHFGSRIKSVINTPDRLKKSKEHVLHGERNLRK